VAEVRPGVHVIDGGGNVKRHAKCPKLDTRWLF
jgi:hypothetical protein